MEIYHKVWLRSHPERDEAWLIERLRDGFDIHHMDGNHQNNEPSNLVLIESRDHMRLHGCDRLRKLALSSEQKAAVCQEVYEAAKRITSRSDISKRDQSWEAISVELGCSSATARRRAQIHADRNGLSWPLIKRGKKAETSAAYRRVKADKYADVFEQMARVRSQYEPEKETGLIYFSKAVELRKQGVTIERVWSEIARRYDDKIANVAKMARDWALARGVWEEIF